MNPPTYKIVKLMDVKLCLGCRFARFSDVQLEGQLPQRMLNCTRLLCDNHIEDASQPKVERVEEAG